MEELKKLVDEFCKDAQEFIRQQKEFNEKFNNQVNQIIKSMNHGKS